jgi:hypothetical protein
MVHFPKIAMKVNPPINHSKSIKILLNMLLLIKTNISFLLFDSGQIIVLNRFIYEPRAQLRIITIIRAYILSFVSVINHL